MEMAPEAKKVRRRRDFTGSTAVDTSRHFFISWPDLDKWVSVLLEQRKWLLITGPFQSGKSSLAFALADELANRSCISFVTTLTTDMVDVANSSVLSDAEAANSFFALIAEAIEMDSGGRLRRSPPSEATPLGGMTQVQRMLAGGAGQPDVIWFIDEAAYLNEIRRPNIITSFLNGLRTIKQQSRDRGAYRLCSFSLVGTAKTRKLLASARQARLEEASLAGNAYSATSPSARHDSYNPLPPGVPFSPLSLERATDLDLLKEEDIVSLLRQYSREHGVTFRMDSQRAEPDLALRKLASSIYKLTSGYKGLAGSCCDYIQANGIHSVARWKYDLRTGAVPRFVLNYRVYSRIVSNVVTYSEELQQLVLECIHSPSAGVPFNPRDANLVLPAINDGVLRVDSDDAHSSVSITSGMLLAALLEDCLQASGAGVDHVDELEDAVRDCFRFMKPMRLLMNEALNQNGEPTDYIWQTEFLLALRFVLERAYTKRKYAILVECKRGNKQGQRRVRVGFFLRKHASPPKAFEVQGKGDAPSIQEHIRKSDSYRQLFEGCEMNYVYFIVGDDEAARATIEAESRKFKHVKCWFVQYLAGDKVWDVGQLRDSGWHHVRYVEPEASSYPKFTFASRQF